MRDGRRQAGARGALCAPRARAQCHKAPAAPAVLAGDGFAEHSPSCVPALASSWEGTDVVPCPRTI